MKRLLSTVSLLLTFSFVNAQEETTKNRIKEAGITFTSLDNFGLTYRIGNEKSVWRFNTAFLSGSQSDVFASVNGSNGYVQSLGFGFQAGREFRKNVNEHFELRTGTDLMFQYTKLINTFDPSPFTIEEQTNSRDNYTIGIVFVLGMNFIIKENLVLGAEIQPFIAYNKSEDKNKSVTFNGSNYITEENSNTNSSARFGINNEFATLSITYRY